MGDKCIPNANITRKMMGRTNVEVVIAIFVCCLLIQIVILVGKYEQLGDS